MFYGILLFTHDEVSSLFGLPAFRCSAKNCPEAGFFCLNTKLCQGLFMNILGHCMAIVKYRIYNNYYDW